jgi:hypothetical protein
MLASMLTPAAVEPFGFFTWDSFRAGWYLTWRLLVRVIPIAILIGLAVAFLGRANSVTGFLLALGVLGAVVWSIMLIPMLTSQWARECYGQALDGALAVWWGITWRSLGVSLVAAVIMAVPNVVALSLKTAFPDSVLGLLGRLILALLNVANVVVTVLATGWAMSRVAASQLAGVAPIASPLALDEPADEAPPVATRVVAPAPAPAPRAVAPPTTAPAPVRAESSGKMQCPKCGLYETERGSVIGWYCKVCGWRERRR